MTASKAHPAATRQLGVGGVGYRIHVEAGDIGQCGLDASDVTKFRTFRPYGRCQAEQDNRALKWLVGQKGQ
jgi:hypothetical protein